MKGEVAIAVGFLLVATGLLLIAMPRTHPKPVPIAPGTVQRFGEGQVIPPGWTIVGNPNAFGVIVAVKDSPLARPVVPIQTDMSMKVRPGPSPATWWCNGSLGTYSVDPDVPGRINACIYAPDWKPGQTLVIRTENARRTK